MRVAIVGASGRSGTAAANIALAAGHEVVSVVRTAASAPAGTTAKIADARDIPALTAAIRGADAVISSLGHRGGPDAAPGDATVLHDGAVALLAAMATASVSRLVAVSAAGAYVQGDDPLSRFIAKPIVARLFGGVFPDTREMEDVIRASPVVWTILRPSRLVAGDGKTPYRFGIDRAVWWHYNTTFTTVGRAAVDALTTPAWIDHAVFVTE
jgi:putative NADH-flavin reductase